MTGEPEQPRPHRALAPVLDRLRIGKRPLHPACRVPMTSADWLRFVGALGKAVLVAVLWYFVSGLVAGLLWIVVARSSATPDAVVLLVLLGPFVAFVVALVLGIVQAERARAARGVREIPELLQRRRLPCPGCRYDLTGVPEQDGILSCPECGLETFPASELRDLWHGTWLHDFGARPAWRAWRDERQRTGAPVAQDGQNADPSKRAASWGLGAERSETTKAIIARIHDRERPLSPKPRSPGAAVWLVVSVIGAIALAGLGWLVAATLLWGIVSVQFGVASEGVWFLGLVVFALPVGGGLAWLGVRRAQRAYFRKGAGPYRSALIRGEVPCPSCGYDLGGQPESPGSCPECGHAVLGPAAMRELWHGTFAYDLGNKRDWNRWCATFEMPTVASASRPSDGP